MTIDSPDTSLSGTDPLERLVNSIDGELQAFDDETSNEAEDADRGEQHVLFELAGTSYLVLLKQLIEIADVGEVTEVPHCPGWLDGVTNLRGDILAVVDLAEFLKIERSGTRMRTRMLVVHDSKMDRTIGFVVDSVAGVRRLGAGVIRDPGNAVQETLKPFVTGTSEIENRLAVLVDLRRILESEEISSLAAN